MVAIAVVEQAITPDMGCYSVKYLDPCDDGWQFSMDYDWRADNDPGKKNRWTCAESPSNIIHWRFVRGIPDHGYHALLDHFGLEESDMWAMYVSCSALRIVTMSPADLVRIRRIKEDRDGLERKVIMNMRTGCPKGELADGFNGRP